MTLKRSTFLRHLTILFAAVLMLSLSTLGQTLAETPPMGWNSWDAYGTTVTEAEVRANADYMATHLKKFGWEYVVVDIQWYEPNAQAGGYRKDALLDMDEYGRLIPSVNRFPSSAGGKGFKPLADYVHSLGLKFGIHILRGVPRLAAKRKLPILGTKRKANDIDDTKDICAWNTDMYGIKMKEKGAQEYYDSIAQLYAEWGVDFIKADDMTAPYHEAEIGAMSKAIKKTGRPMVLSLSPGDTPIEKVSHLKANAQMWRISGDFWDKWEDLKKQFERTAKWAKHAQPGNWPDADMLPLGRIGIRAEVLPDRQTRFTKNEQITMMTLWSIFRSPLMFGGDLPSNDAWTLSLLTNEKVIAVNQYAQNSRELFNRGDEIGWTADIPDSDDKYLALFNIGDTAAANFKLDCGEVGIVTARCTVTDLWKKTPASAAASSINAKVNIHGAVLFRIAPAK
ncbi:MAG TPA: glycoside hydrolase family 27 protein [Pyrinomonadaceae bacterium]|nr:glycoside hydrolase family 27 protein [Pyrinomonadaceae bacterium]